METLYGLHPVEEALRSGSRRFDHVVVARERQDRRLEKIVEACRERGVRVRTEDGNVKPDSQIRVRLELPAYAGICPFVDTSTGRPQPKTEWVGWLAVSRVKKVDGKSYDVAGRLVDMEEMDRGMLGLYLSTQPLAA